MKAKIKLRINSNGFSYKELNLLLKFENELFYRHWKTLVSTEVYLNGNYMGEKPNNVFYTEILNIISDIEVIKLAGEDFMKEIINEKAKKLKALSKGKEAYLLLKKLSKPIEIEVNI